MAQTIKLTLREIRGLNEIEDVITDNDRWTISHRRIFEYKGKAYLVRYEKGATEYQEGSGTDRDELLDCDEVHQVEKIVKVWEPVA